MAYIGTPGVGRGDAQVFNLAPYLNLYLQEQQQKKQESRAIDKQVADDLAKYTPDGLRQQDVPQFLNQYQNLKNLSIQYRDAIRNPTKNPQAWSEYQSAKNRLTGLIAESKAAKENTKSLYDFRAKNLDRLDDDAFKQAMNLYNAPLGSTEHEQARNFDQSQLVFKAPKMDLIKLYAPLSQLKPEETQVTEGLPTGQFRKVRTKQINPGAIAQYMSAAYDTDLLNAKRGFNDMFDNTPEEERLVLEDYARQYYDPNFKIETPKDLAVASGLFGRVKPSETQDIGGSPYLANQAFQREMQNKRFAHAEKMAADKDAKKEKDKYIWESEMTKYLHNNDTKNILRLATELESSSPGARGLFLKSGSTHVADIETFKRELKVKGVDSKTRQLNDADFKAGVLMMMVPKTDKDGNRIKDQYEYLAVSARDKYIENRLNKLKNYAIGGSVKPLTDQIYQEQPEQTGAPVFNLDELSPSNQ